MRTNYPKEYLERCQADMASRAGAVAIANAVETDLTNLAKLVAAANKAASVEEDKSAATPAVADGAAGNGGAEESKGADGDASHQSHSSATAAATATATATGETSAATDQAPPVGESG